MGIFQPVMWSLLIDLYNMSFLSSFKHFFFFTFGAHLLQPTKEGHDNCIIHLHRGNQMGVLRTQSNFRILR